MQVRKICISKYIHTQ